MSMRILAFSTVTVMYLVAKPLNRNEPEGDPVLIETRRYSVIKNEVCIITRSTLASYQF